jgi:uncharacterized protein (TIGR02271 family)
MTMHADQLVGAPVIDSAGQAVGTIEQVFRDDVDGTPSWARIRSGQGLHFVPLAGSSMTNAGGLNVPFDSDKILSEPNLGVDRHMSVDQEEELRKYFGLNVPAQAQPSEPGGQAGQAAAQAAAQAKTGQAPAGRTQTGNAQSGTTQTGMAQPGTQPGTTQPDLATQPGKADPARMAAGQPASAPAEWLVRSEERMSVNLETSEIGRVTLHKHIDTEQVQQTVHGFHEEYEIERVPITKDDRISGNLAESEQQVILHEAKPIISKETVPVERVRLSVKKVDEDKTVSGQIRKERIEVDSDGDRLADRSPSDGRPRK